MNYKYTVDSNEQRELVIALDQRIKLLNERRARALAYTRHDALSLADFECTKSSLVTAKSLLAKVTKI